MLGVGETIPGPIYRLAISEGCTYRCTYCVDIGGLANSNKKLEDLKRAIVKAKKGKYRTITLTCSSGSSGLLNEFVVTILEHGLNCLLQVNAKSYQAFQQQYPHYFEWENVYVLIVSSKATELSPKYVNDKKSIWFLYIVTRRAFDSEELQHLVKIASDRLFFCFPIRQDGRDHLLGPSEIQLYKRRLRKLIANFRIRTLSGLDLYDGRINGTTELEPLMEAQIIYQKSTQLVPEVSVIIPTYNSIETLIPTLEGLTRQRLAEKTIEVIIVDDGSDDGTKERLMSWSHRIQLGPIYSLRYIYLQRPQKQSRGGFSFHAGIARNHGVDCSRGQYLLFLDSDIIVPVCYLSEILKLAPKYSLIQSKRLNFVPNGDKYEYDYISDNCTLSEMDNSFLKILEQVPWDNVENKWKYVCTYCLFVSREQFYGLGRFRKSFCSYGHEDTEFGYRSAMAGGKFYFLIKPVYHFSPKKQRSEYANSQFKKRYLMVHSAQTFFCLHPRSEVYKELTWLWPASKVDRIRYGLPGLQLELNKWVKFATSTISKIVRRKVTPLVAERPANFD